MQLKQELEVLMKSTEYKIGESECSNVVIADFYFSVIKSVHNIAGESLRKKITSKLLFEL